MAKRRITAISIVGGKVVFGSGKELVHLRWRRLPRELDGDVGLASLDQNKGAVR
jgi:hypothetical protein